MLKSTPSLLPLSRSGHFRLLLALFQMSTGHTMQDHETPARYFMSVSQSPQVDWGTFLRAFNHLGLLGTPPGPDPWKYPCYWINKRSPCCPHVLHSMECYSGIKNITISSPQKWINPVHYHYRVSNLKIRKSRYKRILDDFIQIPPGKERHTENSQNLVAKTRLTRHAPVKSFLRCTLF